MASVNGLKDIEKRLDDLLESSEDIRAQIKVENDRRDQQNRNNETRMRTNRFTARIAIIVAVIGILVGYSGRHDAHTASRSAARANAAAHVAQVANVKTNQILASSRKGSCNAQVVSALKANKGQKDQIRVLVDALLAANHTPPSPELNAAVARFYVKYDHTVDKDNPLRDCTPRGIACFLNIAPPVGTLPCNGYDGYLPV